MGLRISAWRVAALATLATAGAGALPASAAATEDACSAVKDNHFFVADATKPGVIDLHFYNAGSARVVFFECVGDKLRRLGSSRKPPNDPGPPTSATKLLDATSWKCTRRSRRFEATTTLPDGRPAIGAYSVRTPSCSERFELRVPRRVKRGGLARMRIVDRWGNGAITPRLCVTPPRAERRCRKVRLKRAISAATRRQRARTNGRWRVELRVRSHRLRTSFQVGGGKVRRESTPTLLATGDSTMQGIDSFLGDELGDRYDVRADAVPGSQLSRTSFWPRHAKQQTRARRQDITVMSLGGASDGFEMTTPEGVRLGCCELAWAQEYARRVRSLMQVYRRGGRGRVFWLTLPAPRFESRARTATAINAAVVGAATGLKGVTVIRIDQIFSPLGFQQTIRYRGRQVDVREPDGIHLNIAGTAIAAREIARQIRAK